MKNQLKFIVPLLVVLAAGGYKFAIAKPVEDGPPPKVEGEVYVLPKEFLVNLSGGQYAKLGVALVFAEGYHAAAEGGGHGGKPAKPPEGFGILPQEPVVRAIVTDELTGAEAKDLTSSKGREKVKEHILERLHEESDVEVEDVLFTDIAVQ